MAKKECVYCKKVFETGAAISTGEFLRRSACSYECSQLKSRKSLIGKRSGRLEVIGEYNLPGKKMIICRCDCGVVKEFTATTVFRSRDNTTKSCGCIKKEQSLPEAPKKFWGSWSAMKMRALYPEHSGESYTFKGDSIEKDWLNPSLFWRDMLHSFKDHVKKYGDDVSIDRIDNKIGYLRGNCRWATRDQQARNKSTTHLVISEKLGICTVQDYEEKTGTKIANRVYRNLRLPDGVHYYGRLGDS